MAAQRNARRLTTIFYADAVGYGRAMSADEDGAYEALRRHRELMIARFDRYGGRLVNTWGDAVIAEFASVVEAVRCAVDIQDAIGVNDSDDQDAAHMAFRIGINLGDVMVDGDDIYGDGVNMAARLEALAPPGGILVSQQVYDLAHRQLAIAFDYSGERLGKDGEEAIRAYAVRLDRTNAAPSDPGSIVPQAPARPQEGQSDGGAPIGKTNPLYSSIRWLNGQSPLVQGAAAIIAFLFFMNLITVGLSPPWFLYPTAALLLVMFLFRRKPG